MIRALHRWPGLVAGVVLVILAISGAMLALVPLMDLGTPAATGSVADLAARIVALDPSVTEILRAPSGRITAYFDSLGGAAQVIDPATGEVLGPVQSSAWVDWLTELHRSLFLSDGGRIGMGLAAAAMPALCLSGLALLARRSGGWRNLFAPQAAGKGWLHAVLGRLALMGLGLSSITALWMTAATFGMIPESGAAAFPAAVSGQVGVDLAQVAVLQDTPVTMLRDLVFPFAGDATDAFALTTTAGQGFIDQGTGQVLSWQDASLWDRITALATALHTGRGMAWVGLILGLSALNVPVMAWTGAVQYLSGRRRGFAGVPAGQADVVVLVGSEGGTTWGYAQALAGALTGQGRKVHLAPLSGWKPETYAKADLALILAATYGAGEAPGSAAGFLDRLARGPAPKMPVAILGFGDRSFPDFCAYARDIAAEAERLGWRQILPLAKVDRQSAQDFARWGQDLGTALRMDLALSHVPDLPPVQALTLVSRRDYGQAVQAPSAILRFALPKPRLWDRLLGRGWQFRAGDLLGILPDGSDLPRFYSLASGREDGFIEICLRRHPGGLCSGQLMALEPGQTVRAFVRANRGFHPAPGKTPVILVGAGTGIGPLAGFARANAGGRAMHLFYGLRDAASDLMYAEEMRDWLEQRHLHSVQAAFSRGTPKAYVQDELRRDAARLVRLVQAGGQVLVCGGRDMAAGVRAAFEEILAPLGLTPALLMAEGRYAEDVY